MKIKIITKRIYADDDFLSMPALILSGCGVKSQKVYKVGILSGMDAFAERGRRFQTKNDGPGLYRRKKYRL